MAAHIFYSIRRKAPKISPQDCMVSPAGCMESAQRAVWHQADESMHGYTVITYACGNYIQPLCGWLHTKPPSSAWIKNALAKASAFFGAGNRTWTCTSGTPDPKSGASANSAIPAYKLFLFTMGWKRFSNDRFVFLPRSNNYLSDLPRQYKTLH